MVETELDTYLAEKQKTADRLNAMTLYVLQMQVVAFLELCDAIQNGDDLTTYNPDNVALARKHQCNIGAILREIVDEAFSADHKDE